MFPVEPRRKADENYFFKQPSYDQAINFQSLAAFNREFKDCLVASHGRFNFKNADHLRCLTKALMLRDFNIQLHLPSNRLCPPVPIRWLYVQWIQQLVESTRPDTSATRSSPIAGLDIGVGASCIYPLLHCASKSRWRMYGTDIDATNYQHAIHNVALNDWDGRIKLLHTKANDPLLPIEALKVNKLDFTMCNPPFFATKEEALATFAKDQQPFAACTGADIEMITPGGEVVHVRRIIDESVVLRDRVQWCTVQLGKLSSLHALVKVLRDELRCKNWVVSVLQPSGQTVRWVLGWSWMHFRAPDEIARHKSLIGTHLQAEPNEMTVVEATQTDPWPILQTEFQSLPLRLEVVPGESRNASHHDCSIVTVAVDSAVWSRSARRKRQRELQGKPENMSPPTELSQDLANIFTITIARREASSDGSGMFSVLVRWVKGEDRAVFESFHGILKSKITAATKT